MSADVERLAALLEPFPSEQVGKLPRITCAQCRDARGKVCDKHSKVRCETCRNLISSAHIHLDYVGHAAVTKRLLSVDPGWSWEPVAWDQDGLPKIVRGGGDSILWIRMTVCGVTRFGVGIAGGLELEKQLISDAIRNAAMRFGVAIDLWSKEDLSSHDDEQQPQADEPTKLISQSQAASLMARLAGLDGYSDAWKAARLPARKDIASLPASRLDEAVAILDAWEAADVVAAAAPTGATPPAGVDDTLTPVSSAATGERSAAATTRTKTAAK